MDLEPPKYNYYSLQAKRCSAILVVKHRGFWNLQVDLEPPKLNYYSLL